MSFQLPSKMNITETEAPRWSGAAVLVESMLLLVFLIASLAVFTQMFATSVGRADESAKLTAAVAAASETAEQFAANPMRVAGERTVDDLLVVCDVQGEQRQSGTLYHADIAVYAPSGQAAASADGEPVYKVSTSHFESEVG